MATEKRLVWTTDVMSFLCKRCNEMYPDEPCEPCDCLMTEELDKCKTVNAVPVVHGRWEDRENPQWKAYDIRYCSVCGWNIPKTKLRQKDSHWNYCPNCGADMRERKDND